MTQLLILLITETIDISLDQLATNIISKKPTIPSSWPP